MVRKDGSWTIYMIQHKTKDGHWAYSSFDYFGLPGDWTSKKGFGANGDCWQETGEHGTFDKQVAIDGVNELARKHPGTEFRCVEVVITQKTSPVSYSKVE